MAKAFQIESLESRSLLSGTLDPSFGTNGVLAGDANVYPAAQAVVVQPDGKIVFAGGAALNPTLPELVRINADGTPDSTFGNGGASVLSGTLFSSISALALLPDGKFIAAGIGDSGVITARFDATGALDTTFGNAGLAYSGFSASNFNNDKVALALQPDGDILVGGIGSGGAFNVERWTAAGQPDSTFGTQGVVVFGQSFTELTAIAVAKDGSIYVGGDNGVISLIHLTSAGVLDTAFGKAGVATLKHAGGCQLAGIVLQSDGKIVIGGSSDTTVYTLNGHGQSGGMLAARFTASGLLDKTFGKRGVAFASFLDRGTPNPQHAARNGTAAAIAIQPDGRIILAGNVDLEDQDTTAPALANDFAAVRFLPNGKPDPSFGASGERTISSGNLWPSVVNAANAIAIEPNGTIVLAGGSGGYEVPGGGNAALVRCLPNGRLDSSFGYEGRFGPFPIAPPSESAAVQSDGKLVLADPTGLSRLLPDGQLDPTFGRGGLVLASQDSVDATRTGISSQVPDVRALPDGKLLEALSITNSGIGRGAVESLEFVRYNANGSLDRTFGADGTSVFYETKLGGYPSLLDMAIQPDEKILLLGEGGVDPGERVFITRLTADGALDAGFGNHGSVNVGVTGSATGGFSQIVLSPSGDISLYGSTSQDGELSSCELNARGAFIDAPNSYPIESDSELLAAMPQPDGSNWLFVQGQTDIEIMRFNGAILDTTFGTNGVISIVKPTDFDVIPGFIVQSGADYLLAGVGNPASPEVLAITQAGAIDTTYGDQGVLTLPQGALYLANSMLLDPDGSVTLVNSGYIIRIS